MMKKHREALRSDEMWLAVLVFLIVALVAPASHAQDIATDPFVQQQLDRSNWEPGGSRFPGAFFQRGPIVLQGGAVVVSPFPKQQIGAFVLQQGAVLGQYTYTIDLSAPHGFNVHADFDIAISAAGSASLKTPTQEIDLSLSWDALLSHPPNAYDPPTGGGFPAAAGARDEFTFDITGTVSGVFFAPSAGGSPFAATQVGFQSFQSSPVSLNGPVNGAAPGGFGTSGTTNTSQNIQLQASINPNSANQTASARYDEVAQTTPQYISGRSGFLQVAAVVWRAVAKPVLQVGEARRRAWWEGLTDQERQTVTQALPYAHLIKTFKDSRTLPPEWERIKLDPQSEQRKSGFSGAAFVNNDTREVVIIFEGTKWNSLADWRSNVSSLFVLSAQHQDALDFATDVRSELRSYPDADVSNITVIGHSLGGNLAQLVAADRGYAAYTFNAAPLGEFPAGLVPSSITAEEKINNITLSADPIGGVIARVEKTTIVGGYLIADDPFGPPITIPYFNPAYAHFIATVVKVLEEVTSY